MQPMPVIGIHAHGSYNAALSPREVALLSGWERARRRWVTLADVQLATNRQVGAKVASALVRKGVLVRLKPGLYLVRPFRQLHHPTATSAPLALEVLLHDEPHYLGGLWAFTQNGLTSQQYRSRLDAFVARPHRPRGVAGARVVFHRLPVAALQVGVVETVIEGLPVRMSDGERTLVDLLEWPRIAGGLVGAIELFERALSKVQMGRVASLGAQVAGTSTCQRMGLLLERAGASSAALRPLTARARGTKSLISMRPGPRTGRVNVRWSVVENDHVLGTPSAS